MSRNQYISQRPSWISRGFTVALLLVMAVSAVAFSLTRPDSASAHCDSINGPVVTAATAALEANDVRLILPYVHVEAESELTAAFEQTMEVRALGGEAQTMADRYFFETAVRLHREGEGAPYTGLKESEDIDPALEAADAALEGESLTGLYDVLDGSIRAGIEARYQAVLEAREHEADEGTVEAARARAEAELQFETYVHSISQAAGELAGHGEGEAHAVSAQPSAYGMSRLIQVQ